MPKLAIKEDCTGCTACAAACPKDCITMTADEKGFLRPVLQLDHCVSCGLCEKSCPVKTKRKISNNDPKAYAAYATDTTVRLQSSSGGIFTEIAKEVLAEGGVVFGAAYREQFDVVHVCVETEKDLAELRGAKYAQSNLCGILPEVKARLDAGQPVLFSGTPCQVAGLKAYLMKEYANLLTVDCVCHSVPSPSVWREYVKYRAALDEKSELPSMINLRSKETGWSRYQYSNVFGYADGTSYAVKSNESLYMKLFVGGYISRESCAQCSFKGYQRISDLTLGDFWGIWNIAPEMDDDQGTSLVLVQSEKGQRYFDAIRDSLHIKQVTLEQASRENPAILVSFPQKDNREVLMNAICTEGFHRAETFLPKTSPLSLLSRLKRKLTRMLLKNTQETEG